MKYITAYSHERLPPAASKGCHFDCDYLTV
jgi:hypothetical protein